MANYYSPIREWSRVQNRCFIDPDNTDKLVKIPLLNKTVPVEQAGYWLAMLNKGNILQYKNNSSSLTKKERYSKIAKGQWVNRNTTWATQNTKGYTNPNTTMLARSGNVVNIAISQTTGTIIGETTAPVTCGSIMNKYNFMLPPSGSSQSAGVDNPTILPEPIPASAEITVPYITPGPPPQPIVVQDSGVLLCNEREFICTGKKIKNPATMPYHLTSDSDVPGPIEALYWNDGITPWYPKQRYIMTNSDNKWPESSSSITYQSALRPLAPILSFDNEISTLTWSYDDTCLPINYFIIYKNEIAIANVEFPTNTYIINELIIDDIYNVTCVTITGSTISESLQSNTITI